MRAHFHALYAGYQVTVEIETGAINGRFPPRASRLITKWLSLRRNELMNNRERLPKRLPLEMISPLE